MTVERIDDNCVQIQCTESELKSHSLNINKLNFDAPTCKRFMQSLIRHAEIELDRSISTVRINTAVSADGDRICFMLENISGENGVPQQGLNPGTVPAEAGESRRGRRDQNPLVDVPMKNVPKPAEAGAQNESQSAGNAPAGGGDLAEALMRKIMLDGLITAQAALRSLGAGRRGQNQPAQGPDAAVDGGDADSELPDEYREDGERLGDALEYRRDLLFGEHFESVGGTAVVAFARYQDLYDFFSTRNGFGKMKSELYEYRGIYYIVLYADSSSSVRFYTLDSLVSEYRGVLIPARQCVPVLKEYATTIYGKTAIKKIKNNPPARS